jgi:serine O-acetyltransferase
VESSRDLIRSKHDYLQFLREDLRAHGVDRWRFFYRLTRPTLFYQRILRRVEYLNSIDCILARLLLIVARVRLARMSTRLGISIPPGVFGRGLSIAHYGSIVVNNEVAVGKYCRIHSATNIGVYAGSAPTIGDYVYIGPGAVIYGGVSLGDQVAVGANTVVGRSFDGPATLGGVPAKVVSSVGSRAVMPEWMPTPATHGDRQVVRHD